MLDDIKLRNFGPPRRLEWSGLGSINLVIGRNGAGKTFLLKALYCAARTVKAHGRGDDKRSEAEIVLDKLCWTFQEDKVCDLVMKGTDAPPTAPRSQNLGRDSKACSAEGWPR